MADIAAKKPERPFEAEERWLQEYALFYGTTGVTRYSAVDLNGVPLVHVVEALARPISIRCDKCDGPGSVCAIEANVGDNQRVRVVVHFVSQEARVTIRKAMPVEEPRRDPPDAA